ncbi:MAG: TIGR02281 family clan AA aspartic protease [Porticoccaceae bacterium]|nr:TIGR02281 family clan AA aspartic protease [Porticoccaceae bacterium]
MAGNNDISMAFMTLRGNRFREIQLRGKYFVAVFALLLLLSSKLWAGPEIIANGLFANKAMLTIDGNTRFLKAGETSPEGVKLLRSSSKQAVIEVDGKPVTLKVSQRISSSFKAAERTVVNLPRGKNGHFYARGAINGYPTSFMVDTGATSVAMNQNHARQFGIDASKGTESAASTAGGIVKTHMVTLQKVSVGGITVHNVPASIVDGDFPAQILLGNSFLSQVDMSEQAGVLVLKKKF